MGVMRFSLSLRPGDPHCPADVTDGSRRLRARGRSVVLTRADERQADRNARHRTSAGCQVAPGATVTIAVRWVSHQ